MADYLESELGGVVDAYAERLREDDDATFGEARQRATSAMRRRGVGREEEDNLFDDYE